MRVVMIDAANQTPFYVYPLCRALAAAGCTVELVTAPFLYGALPEGGVPVHQSFGRVARLPPLRRMQRPRQVVRGLEYPLDWAVVLRHIRAIRPDVVHVQWAMLPAVDALAFRAIRALGPRLVYTVHDIRSRYGWWRRTWLSTTSLYALADDLIVHSEASKAALCAAAGAGPSRVHVIRPGALSEWSGPPVARNLARAKLALPPKAPLVLFFGGIKPYKGLNLLIEALPRVVERLPTARLVIAGRPAEPFARYERAIDRLQLDDHIIRRLGYVPEDEVAPYFSAADVVALPYTEGDFSGVLMAAYAFGCPVVATDTGGIGQTVAKDDTGYMVPPRDRRALAEAIVRVLADPATGARMGARARELALTECSWPTSARDTIRLYGQSRPGRC